MSEPKGNPSTYRQQNGVKEANNALQNAQVSATSELLQVQTIRCISDLSSTLYD